MPSKRFIDNSILPKAFRKLDVSLKLTWYYIWNECDKSGVYEVDEDLFEFENGFKIDVENFINAFPGMLEVWEDKILIKDFIRIDCGKLTENYNPHKPYFRAIEENGIAINPSLNQAYFKIGDGDRDRDVDFEGGVGETFLWPTFDDFWDEYDKKIGKKSKLKKKWDKVPQKTKEKIMAYIPKYKEYQPDKKFRKNPETFFNNEGWEDELPTSVKKENSHLKNATSL